MFKSEQIVKLTKLLVIAVSAASLQACTGALAGGTINNPFTPPPEAPPAVYDGHVKHVGIWLDAKHPEITTFASYWVSCDDDSAASQLDPSDRRPILWHIDLFGYGPTPRSRNGYFLRDDYVACWARLLPLMASPRTLGIHLLDEPDAVACGDAPDTDGIPCGTPDDVDWNLNLYNADITRAAALIHADLPHVKVSINYGNVLPRLIVPSGLDWVFVETYGDDWQRKLTTLETLTPLYLWMMPAGFVDGDPVAADPILAQRVRDQWAWMQHDSRVVGAYWFLFCCDDLVTGNKSFYTAGGGRLPLTRQALVDLGLAIIGAPR